MGIFHTTRRLRSAIGIGLTLACLLVWPVVAHDAPADVPPLTDSQRLELQAAFANALLAKKDVEIAQLRSDAANGLLARLAQSLERPGFELDIQTQTYKPRPQPPAETK